jgi:hypothetical protein
MTETTDRQLRRFLRSTRIALGTSLAGHELAARLGSGLPIARFGALAAKGAEAWRFPADGLLSDDGMVLAQVRRDGEGRAATLSLQAQGVSGLDALADRSLVARFGLVEVPVAFDREGKGEVDLAPHDLAEEELADFALGAAPGAL